MSTIDYHEALRKRTIEARWGICLKPSLVWDRNIVALAERPDVEALETLDSQIRDATVVAVFRAYTQDESWALDQRYDGVKEGTPAARDLDKATLVEAFVRFETLDGDLLGDLTAEDFAAYWDSINPGERGALLAFSLQLKTFTPDVPF